MQLRMIAVGRMREPYLVAAADDFRRRLRPYHRLDETEVRAADGGDPERAMQIEGEAVLRLLAPADHVWLLERDGTQFSSEELAERLDTLALGGTSRVTFVIAGTYGASPALLARANVRWSLSRLTLLHEWARALVLEQLYRAAKIAHDEPYHH
jgi:23S rRNA (pseudouridine1915-N3)-methyltransferase